MLLHYWVELNNPINNGIATFCFCLAYYQAAFLSITNSSLVYMYRKCDPSLCYVSPQQEQEIYIFFMLKVKYIIYILNPDVAEKNYLLCKDIVE